MTDQRNLILAVALSILILVGFQYLFPPPEPPARQQQASEVPTPGATTPEPPTPALTREQSRAQALAAAPRIPIETPSLKGSLSLVGGRLDDLILPEFREEPKPDSPAITLLSPPGGPAPYYMEFGWVPEDKAIPTPGAKTEWRLVQGDRLTPETPVVLAWDNGQGLTFTRTYKVDRDYLFTVVQKVENTGAQPVTLFPYALDVRSDTPETAGFYILHEGPLGVIGGTLQEIDYEELRDDRTVESETTGGWIGITDKYWLTALIPDQQAQVKARFTWRTVDNHDKYQVDWLGSPRTVAPGDAAEVTHHAFAGAKKVSLLDEYADELGIPRFDRAIDFGWFYFLTKPFFYLLQFLHKMVGNFGLAILGVTVLIKLALFPLANQSYRAMSKMKKLQPEVQRLQERFGEDKMRLNQELMALYRREKANPVSGCLPILIQIPIFFALYKVLFVTLEMRHAPFYGWIDDLSAPDPTTIFNLFGLIPWDPPSFLMLGVWPIIMGVTMWLQQKLNPQPADPIQAKMFMFLPIVFTFLLASFPAGLVIYWAWSNMLSIAQQWVIMRQMGVKL